MNRPFFVADRAVFDWSSIDSSCLCPPKCLVNRVVGAELGPIFLIRHQSCGNLLFGVSSSNSSAPTPLTAFTWRLKGPFRLDRNAMRIPSGDQTGLPFRIAAQ